MENHETHQRDPEITTPPPPPEPDAEPEPEPSLSGWLVQNATVLAIVAALFVFVYVKFEPDLWALAKMALGLGFVIFIHELGHFLVAKWCDVHVQVFSIGFGPALPGCRFTWGETTYKLALFPLGGYVQMVGQVDGSEENDGTDDDPRSYRNKTVWQRMSIISAGVVMNAALAVICFAVVFLGPGKDRRAAVVMRVDAGSPAFKKGVRTGAVIHQIGSVQEPYFEQVKATVINTTQGEEIPLVFSRPGDKTPTAIEIKPRKDKGKLRMLGIEPALSLKMAEQRFVGKDCDRPAWPGTSADKAQPAFAFSDRIVAMTDPEDPTQITALPLDPRKNDGKQRDYFVFAQRMRLLAGQEVTLRVEREQDGKVATKDIKVSPAFHTTVGARMTMGEVSTLREGAEAADKDKGVQARDHLEGDVIEQVEVTEPDGITTRFVATRASDPAAKLAGALLLPAEVRAWAMPQALANDLLLDPVRLPYQLRQWAGRLAKAKVPPEQWVVRLHVRRHNAQPGQQYSQVVVPLTWQQDWTFDQAEPFYPTSPIGIPELGFAYKVKTTVAGVDASAGLAGDNRLQPGDEIKEIKFHVVIDKNGKVKEGQWIPLKDDQWAWSFAQMQQPAHVVKVSLQVERNKETRVIEVDLRPDESWPQEDCGLLLSPDWRHQKADGFFEAVAIGLGETQSSMVQVFLNVRGMITGDIPVENLGGPLTIGVVAYSIAGVDFGEFVFFLGLISINLAVINFLPVPVLDGGHMVFLLYEKVRGKPASEQVRVGATYVGLLLLASLMIFVFYLDITRWLFKG